MQVYASSILYHLVGGRNPNDDEANFDTLCLILKSMMIKPREVAGKSGITIQIDLAREMQFGELIEQSVCCFCDIHLSQLSPIHTSKYGRFGVGVDRHWVAEWGGRPVIYLPTTRTIPLTWGTRFKQEIMDVWKGLHEHFGDTETGIKTTEKIWGTPPATAQEAVENASTLLGRDVLAFLKAFDVDLPADHPDNYYMEREWRKYAGLPLELPLREIVVPIVYAERMRAQFPSLGAMIVHLPEADGE